MLDKLFPKEFDFFKLFTSSADLIVRASESFKNMVAHPDSVVISAQKIKDLEHEADGVTHQTMTLLHKTFITPIDRQDIHDLIKRLDDIIDFMDAAASRVVMYEIKSFPPEIIALARVNYDCAVHVRSAIEGLKDLKNPKSLKQHCIEINRLENEADQILRSGVASLFKNESDVKQLIKLKEIFELLETVSDRCEDVANVVESIVLEYA